MKEDNINENIPRSDQDNSERLRDLSDILRNDVLRYDRLLDITEETK